MGLIQRQGFKYSIVNWIGVFIGALSTLFVFPNALEEYGLMRFVLDTSTLLFPLLSFGINSIAIRFFPYFEDKEQHHNGFLGFLLIWGLTSYLLVVFGFLLFKDQIFAFYGSKSPLFKDYLWILLPSMFFITLNNILSQYAVNFKRIVIPSLLLDVSQKVVLPLLILAYMNRWFSLSWMMNFLIIYLAIVTIGFLFYISHLKALFIKPNFNILTPALRKQIRDYALFGLVGGLGFLLISKLDSWLVSTFISLRKNGIYSISAFVANVMEVPARAVLGISTPLIAKYWREKNTKEIDILYQKASINLLIMGLLIFGIFWVSVDAFFKIIANGDEMISGKMIILLLGIGRLVDMATGVNNYVLNYSDHYRYSYLQIILPATISVAMGLWLTPLYGMTGAAATTLISVILYNAISVVLNWHFFKLQPFSINTIWILLAGLAAYGCSIIIPTGWIHWLPAAVIHSGIFALTFLGIIWKARLSDDLSKIFDTYISSKLIKKT